VKEFPIHALQFNLDNKYIAVAGHEKGEGQINVVEGFLFLGCIHLIVAFQLWEIGRRRVRATFKHDLFVASLDLSPDGRLLIAPLGPSVVLWNVRDGSRRTLCGPLGVTSVSFSPDGRYILAGGYDGALCVWDARTAQLVTKCEFGRGAISMNVLFTPDGKGVAAGGSLWDFKDILSGKHRDGMEIFNFDDSKLGVCSLTSTFNEILM
jgi:WD40 repeat protein